MEDRPDPVAVPVVEGIPHVALRAEGGALRHAEATLISDGVVEHVMVAHSHHPLATGQLSIVYTQC